MQMPRWTMAVAATFIALGCDMPDDVTQPPSASPAILDEGLDQVYWAEGSFRRLTDQLPSHGGFYIDGTGSLVVAVADPADSLAAVRALRHATARASERSGRRGIRPLVVRRVKYSFAELSRWRNTLHRHTLALPTVAWLDLDEVRNAVVIGLEHPADSASVRREASVLGVPRSALHFEVTGPVSFEQQTLSDEVRPIQGGLRIERVDGGSIFACTLGIPVLWKDTLEAFITSSHCSAQHMLTDGTLQYQPHAPRDTVQSASIGVEIADVHEVCSVGKCSWADAAIYKATAPWLLGRIAKPEWGRAGGSGMATDTIDARIPMWSVTASRDSAWVGDLVSRVGAASGWYQGWVQKTCVTISAKKQGVAYYCQTFADYYSAPGDSGSPVFTDVGGYPDSTVTIMGIHSNTTGAYRVFSPWQGVLRDYPGVKAYH